MTQEELYTIFAKRSAETGSPLLGDVWLHTGYGSVELKQGQSAADVPATVALALKGSRDDVLVVPSGELGDAPAAVEMPEDTAAIKLAEAQQKLAAAEAALLVANGQAGQAESESTIRIPGPNGEVIVLTQEQLAAIAIEHLSQQSGTDTATQERLQAAREHLAEEGEEVPDTLTPGAGTPPSPPAEGPVLIPQGFDTNLPDGTARCLAKKADDSQCKNPAVDGSKACALARHKDQLTAQTTPSEGA